MNNRPEAYDQFVNDRIAAGDDPNDITEWLEEALSASSGYMLWGDGRWRIDDVCAVCGSSMAGVCGHSAYEIPKVLRSEFVPGKHGDPDIIKCRSCGREAHKDEMTLDILGRCEQCSSRGTKDYYVPLDREVTG